MTDLRKAAELALDALEILSKNELPKKGAAKAELDEVMIPILRQALAQPEQEQKTPLKVLNLTVFTENRLRNGRVYDVETLQAMTNRDILAIPDMGKKALAEVLEALNVYAVNISQERVDETVKREHEPVVWMNKYGHVASFQNEEYKDPLYTAPPKREWVGLTKAEFEEAVDGLEDLEDCYKAIEAKLKEKNT